MRNPAGFRRIAMWFLAGVLVLAASVPATAATATHRTIELDESTTFPALLCGFPIERHITGTLHIIELVGDDGTVVRSINSGARVRVGFTNLDTGAAYSSVSSVTEHITYRADGSTTVILTGLLGHIVEPGRGLVSADLGRVVLVFGPAPGSPPAVMSQSGIWSDGAIDPLCAALS